MLLQAYSIYDSAIAAYKGIYLFQSEMEAKRAAVDLLTQQQSNINQHPQDYALMRIGTWNDATGEFTSGESIKTLVNFWELQAELSNRELNSDQPK